MGLSLVIYAVFGLLLLLLVWPTDRTARRLLNTWRVPDPTAEQVAEALSYLRRRRFWYPWFFLAAPLVPGWGGARQSSYNHFLITVLAGLLIAELLALRPARDRVRTASLTPRELFDLVPKWAVVLYACLGLASTGFAVAGLIGQQWAWRQSLDSGFGLPDLYGPEPWIVLLATMACLLAVGAVCLLAVIRPAGGDGVVDAVLRTRSARVALGLGIALQGQLLATAAGRIAMYDITSLEWLRELYRLTSRVPTAAWAGSILAWIWVANPPATVRMLARRNR